MFVFCILSVCKPAFWLLYINKVMFYVYGDTCHVLYPATSMQTVQLPSPTVPPDRLSAAWTGPVGVCVAYRRHAGCECVMQRGRVENYTGIFQENSSRIRICTDNEAIMRRFRPSVRPSVNQQDKSKRRGRTWTRLSGWIDRTAVYRTCRSAHQTHGRSLGTYIQRDQNWSSNLSSARVAPCTGITVLNGFLVVVRIRDLQVPFYCLCLSSSHVIFM